MVSQVHFQQKITELIHELDTLHEASTKSVKTYSLMAMFSRFSMTY